MPPGKVREQFIGVAYPQERTSNASIPEIKFWSLNRALVKVLKIGRKGKSLKTGLKNGEPTPHSFLVNIDQISQVGLIKQLPDPPSTQSNKSLKSIEV